MRRGRTVLADGLSGNAAVFIPDSTISPNPGSCLLAASDALADLLVRMNVTLDFALFAGAVPTFPKDRRGSILHSQPETRD